MVDRYMKEPRYREQVVKATKTMMTRKVELDSKPDIFCFNNVVYDLTKGIFREYESRIRMERANGRGR